MHLLNILLQVLGELLSELAEGQAEEEDTRLLEAVSITCRHMQTRLLELVAVVQHRFSDQIFSPDPLICSLPCRELTAQLLDVNDAMNNQLLRYERYRSNVAAASASPDQVLIDLAPGQHIVSNDSDSTTKSFFEYP